MKTNRPFAFVHLTLLKESCGCFLPRVILRGMVFLVVGVPALLHAQYSEIKMGEYLHYAVAAANGGVYAGYDSIGFAGGSYGTPSLYRTNTGWVDLPSSLGFSTASPYIGQPRGISRDGSVVAGYMSGVATNGISVEYATYWVNGVESLVPAPGRSDTVHNDHHRGLGRWKDSDRAGSNLR